MNWPATFGMLGLLALISVWAWTAIWVEERIQINIDIALIIGLPMLGGALLFGWLVP